MKKSWIINSIIAAFVLIVLTGGIIHIFQTPNEKPPSTPSDDSFKHIEPVGEIPDEFKSIIQNDFFKDISAFGDRLMKVERFPAEDGSNHVHHRILLTDLYANTLCQYELTTSNHHIIQTYSPTNDNGFIFVISFTGEITEDNIRTDGYGYASRVIKVDHTGNLQFSTPLEELYPLFYEYFFEKTGQFYFFGGTSLSEKNSSIPDDVIMTVLDKNGTVQKTRVLSGSGYDSLRLVKAAGDHFLLSIYSSSEDGDFSSPDSSAYGTNWSFTIDEQLDITEKKLGQGIDIFTFPVGVIDGSPVYNTDDRFKDYNFVSLQAYIDYGDFYLIVSKNNSGINYEEIDPESGYTYYQETVYSAYKHTGELLFRTSSDIYQGFVEISIKSADSQ